MKEEWNCTALEETGERGRDVCSVLAVDAFRAGSCRSRPEAVAPGPKGCQIVAPPEAPRSLRSEGGVPMRENVRAPLAGRNHALSSKYAERSIRCRALERTSPSLTEKRSSNGSPTARKTSRVPISLRESNRWSWAPLIREMRSVTGNGEKALRRRTGQGINVGLSLDPFGRFFHPASGARMSLGKPVPHPRSAPQKTRDGASGGATI
jgi:hypothetical protein